jgi:hypothetical protein
VSTLTRRGARANLPARLPGIQAERVDDPNVRQAIEALREWVEVRLGARGDKFERAVTFRDLAEPLKRIEALEGAPATGTTTSTSSDADLAALKNRVSTLEATIIQWQGYGSRITLLEQRLTAVLAAIEALDLLTLDEVRAALNVFRANQSVQPVGLRTNGAVLNLDVSESNNFSIEVDEDVFVAVPAGLTDGMTLNLILQMDEAGGHAVEFDAMFDFAQLPVSVPNSPQDITWVDCYYDAASGKLLCELRPYYSAITRAVATFTGTGSFAGFMPYATIATPGGTSSFVAAATSLGTTVVTAVATFEGTSDGRLRGKKGNIGQGVYLETRTGAGELSGLGAFSASGVLTVTTAATLAGTATLGATGGAQGAAAASFAGTSTVAGSGGGVLSGAASLSGTGALAAVGGTVAPPSEHRYWRLNGFQVSGSRLDLSEVQFLAGGVNQVAAFTYSSSIAPAFGTLSAMFDGGDSSVGSRCYWNETDAEGAGFYIQVDFGAERTVSGVKLGGHDTSSRYPTGITLQYSDDGSSWTTQGSASSLTWPGNGVLSSEIVMGTASKHRYWRLTNWTGLSGFLEISEIQWVNSGLKHTTVFTAQSVAGANSHGSDPSFLKDGSLTTWLGWGDTTAEDPAFWIKVDLREAAAVDAIKLGASNVSANHPTQVTLQYSDNDTTWATAGSATGLTFPGNNTLSGSITF